VERYVEGEKSGVRKSLRWRGAGYGSVSTSSESPLFERESPNYKMRSVAVDRRRHKVAIRYVHSHRTDS
jgi:hypothetical protein